MPGTRARRVLYPVMTSLAALALSSRGAVAQRTTRLEIDNDAFNFWQAPGRRADREYTQGTRVVLLWPGGGSLARRLLGGPAVCRTATDTRDCRLVSAALVQEIYTPTLSRRRRLVGERPFAGFLGTEWALRRERVRGFTAFGVSAGMTGSASLAEPAQKAVHSLFGFTTPTGWDAQVPTELALLASWQGAEELVGVQSARTGLGLHVAPNWKLRAGTLATDATVGLQLTAGLRAPAPWQVALAPGRERWGVYVRAGASQAAVARNLFLDGSTFGTSARVPRNRIVGETMLGIGVRAPRGLVEWQVHSRSREYPQQPLAHAYSSFTFTLH